MDGGEEVVSVYSPGGEVVAETFECPREVGDVAVLLTCPPGQRREKGKRGGGGGNEGVGGRREGRRQKMEEMEMEW